MQIYLRRVAACLSAFLVLFGPQAVMADGKSGSVKFSATYSGASVPSAEQDVDGAVEDGVGFVTTTEGRSTVGPVSITTAGDLAEWDGINFCDFTPEGFPIAVPVDYLKSTAIIRTKRGDLIYTALDTAQPGTLCFNFNDSSSTFDVHQIVIGGTGRYEGATGLLHWTGTAQGLDGATGVSGNVKGTIHLAGNGGDDDDDDDDDDDEDD